MRSILININIFFFVLASISSPAVCNTKIKKYFRNLFYFIFLTNWATELCCDWRLVLGGFLLAKPYIPSNISHGTAVQGLVY